MLTKVREGVLAVSWLLLTVCISGEVQSNAAGKAFLEENRALPGVVELPSGLQFKRLRKGAGLFHPAPGTHCNFHYNGTTVDGAVFLRSKERKDGSGESVSDFSSQDAPLPGWAQAMLLMVEGDHWQLFLPSSLAFGDLGHPPYINGGDPVLLTLRLDKIKGGKVMAYQCTAKSRAKCDEAEREYLEDREGRPKEELVQERTLLEKTPLDSVDPDAGDWLMRRLSILNSLTSKPIKLEL